MLRLKTRAQFQAAMAGGIVSRTAHFALHRLALDPSSRTDEPLSEPGSAQEPQALFAVGKTIASPWLGAMVPKRWARRAVTRNAIKRQIYTLSPQWQPALAGGAYVVRLRAAFDRQHYVSAWSEPLRLAVRAELQQLFASACRRLEARP